MLPLQLGSSQRNLGRWRVGRPHGSLRTASRAYLALKPRSDPRLSVASLACFELDGKLLVEDSRKRPGTLEPFGGVRIIFDAGVDELKSRGYRPQTLGTNGPAANACDLRGFLKVRSFLGSGGRSEAALH